MPMTDLLKLNRLAKPLTLDEGLKILERDKFRCQYCGLDGLANFENSMVMSVDFVLPRARKGKKDPGNLVACCRPCNLLKGERVFDNFEAAKAHVLKRRAEMRAEWETKVAKMGGRAAKA